MERLMVVKLDVRECEAEVRLNGIPLARAHPGRPRATVPVHEYALAGVNQLELVVWPAPVVPPGQPAAVSLPLVATGQQVAQAQILLPRIGRVIDESTARTLGQVQWALASGVAYQAPVALVQEVTLPVSFPRWRWLDAPPIDVTPLLHTQAGALLRSLAQDLAEGKPERFIAATRLRTEELALAYQRRAEDETQRWRDHFAGQHAARCVKWPSTLSEGLILRPVAGGRLVECVDASGGPALRTEPNARGETWGLPLRLASISGKYHVLR